MAREEVAVARVVVLPGVEGVMPGAPSVLVWGMMIDDVGYVCARVKLCLEHHNFVCFTSFLPYCSR